MLRALSWTRSLHFALPSSLAALLQPSTSWFPSACVSATLLQAALLLPQRVQATCRRAVEAKLPQTGGQVSAPGFRPRCFCSSIDLPHPHFNLPWAPWLSIQHQCLGLSLPASASTLTLGRQLRLKFQGTWPAGHRPPFLLAAIRQPKRPPGQIALALLLQQPAIRR